MGTEQHDCFDPLEVVHKRAVPLPADFTIPGHLENPPALSLADQRVAVGEPLCPSNVKAQHAENRRTNELPYDLAGFHIDLNNARPPLKGVVGAIVEN